MKRTNRGFTLIELLVVIAIIGILSAVVLASLNTARGKGNDAAIKGNLNGLRATAELYYDSNNQSYGTGTNCITSGFLASSTAMTSITNMSVTPVCHLVGSAYAISSPLKSVSGTSWCIDSTGAATSTTAASTGKCN